MLDYSLASFDLIEAEGPLLGEFVVTVSGSAIGELVLSWISEPYLADSTYVGFRIGVN